MTNIAAILLLFASLLRPACGCEDDPTAKPAGRVVEGRVLDSQGQPVRKGKVFFGPQEVRVPFTEESTASLDNDGRYRIDLKDFPFGEGTMPATGQLRFMVLSPGFRPELGKCEAGSDPLVVDMRLTPEPWKETQLRFVNRQGKAVANVNVDLSIGRWQVEERLTSDAEGRCRVAAPTGVGISITARPEDYLTESFGFRGVADDPVDLTVPVFERIRGHVVDPEGKPLSGIQIGRLIAPDYDFNVPDKQRPLLMYEMKGSPDPATTDKDGRFDLKPAIYLDSRSWDRSGGFRTWPEVLCFADETLRHVAFLGVHLRDVQPSYEVVLKPARQVRIPLEHAVTTPSGRIESSWEISRLSGEGKAVESIRVMSGEVGPKTDAGHVLEAFWPEGRYKLTVNSADPVAEKGLEETSIEVIVPPGDGPLTLPTLRMTALLHHRLVGQPAPEIDVRDLDTGHPIKLADFKGKVVVLDFWGYWCGPCIGSMPELIKVHDQFKDRPVVILAIHDQSVQSREAYDRKLEGIKQNVWEGRELPFRVALDSPDPEVEKGQPGIGQGVTCKRYQIDGFPTTMVIDRDGKVVGTVNTHQHGRLEAMLKEQINKQPSR
jgi:thiol-disulfide isomerase/thioredoxin